MNNEQILKEINECIDNNRLARHSLFESIEPYREATRQSNDVLSKARTVIKNSEKEYERGLEDAWELARKIARTFDKDSLTVKEIHDIYGCAWYKVFTDYTAHDALSLYQDYLKKKEKEAAKPVLGDVVEIIASNHISYNTVVKGIYIKETGAAHNIITNNGDVYVFGKDHVESIKKTGEHVDILGALK